MKTVVVCSFMVLVAAAGVFAQQPPPAKVVVSKVVEKEIAQTNTIVGIVDFDKVSPVSPEVAGLVDSVYVKEGVIVKENDTLAQLKTDFIEKDIAIMKTELEQTEINVENTKRNYDRSATLYKTSSTSQQNYEDLLYSYKALLKKLDITKLNIDKLNLHIAKSFVKSPFDGIILEKNVEVGQWVSHETPLFQIASTKDTIVKVAVSENIINYLVVGGDILVKINSLGKEVNGTIESFIPVAEMKSKTFFVKIKIPYFNNAIQNMSATVYVPISSKMRLKIISRDAIVNFEGKNFIYTVKDNKAVILPVNIVAYIDKYVGVDNPYIAQGMPVVIDGNDRLMPDQAVEISGEK